MIYVGIDDTDTLETPGTNQLAKALARLLAPDYRCLSIVRHQLFFDPRVPYTSKNGSASLLLEPRGEANVGQLTATIRQRMLEWFVPGSDPGLCVATAVDPEITAFAQRAKTDVVTQAEAHAVAEAAGIHLEGLGGTCGGVIGALSAVGLIVTGNDGRIVQFGEWPDDLTGLTPVNVLHHREVLVRCIHSSATVTSGQVDVGKHLRPNLRDGKRVLFVEGRDPQWQAIKLV